MPSDDRVLDLARLSDLRAIDGTGEMLAGAIATFEANCDSLMGDIRTGLLSGDLHHGRESAHILAGQAMMVGAHEAGDLIRRLEKLLAAGDGESAQALWPDVERAFSAARAALADYQAP